MWVVAEYLGTNGLGMSISKDNGATWTALTCIAGATYAYIGVLDMGGFLARVSNAKRGSTTATDNAESYLEISDDGTNWRYARGIWPHDSDTIPVNSIVGVPGKGYLACAGNYYTFATTHAGAAAASAPSLDTCKYVRIS